MKFGIHFIALGKYFSFDDCAGFLKKCKEAGAQAVELYPMGYPLFDNALARKLPAEIKAMARDLDLTMVFTMDYPRDADMCSADAASRARAVERLKTTIQTVHAFGGIELGGITYGVWPAAYEGDMISLEEREVRRERSIACMQQAAPLAEDCGITLDCEIVNRFENPLFNTVAEGKAFVDRIGSKNCGLVLDCHHMNIEEDDMFAAIQLAKGYLHKFHAIEPNRGIPHQFTRIDWNKVGDTLRLIEYDGPVLMEAMLGNDAEVSYDMRAWRNILADESEAGRWEALTDGVAFLKQNVGCER